MSNSKILQPIEKDKFSLFIPKDLWNELNELKKEIDNSVDSLIQKRFIEGVRND